MLTVFIAKGRDLILWTSQNLRTSDVILLSSIPYKVTFKEEGRRGIIIKKFRGQQLFQEEWGLVLFLLIRKSSGRERATVCYKRDNPLKSRWTARRKPALLYCNGRGKSNPATFARIMVGYNVAVCASTRTRNSKGVPAGEH